MPLKVHAYRALMHLNTGLGSIHKARGVWWCHARHCPDWYLGTRMIFPDAPEPGDAPRWEAFWNEFLGETAHFSFGWNHGDNRTGDLSSFLNAGYTRRDAYSVECSHLAAPPTPIPGLEIRTVETEADWQAVLELQCRTEAERPWMGTPGHTRCLMQRYRVLSRQEASIWLGAWMDGILVADLGIFNALDFTAALLNLETHPDYRRRGIATALVHHAGSVALSTRWFRRLLAVEVTDSIALGMYDKLAFEVTEALTEVYRLKRPEEILPLPPPNWEETEEPE